MTRSAAVFMILSWGFVLGLTGWSFVRVFRQPPRDAGPSA